MSLDHVHLARGAVILLSAWTLGVVGAAPASASCATDSPDRSRDAFVGTVVATSEGGRVAEVVTDDGGSVTVQGTDDVSWLTNSYSSSDRRYALGGRYEFHPLNDASPYVDNGCSATRQLSGPPLSAFPEGPAQKRFLPEWLPADEQAGPIGYVLFFGPLAVGALAICALLRGLIRRRRRAASAR